MPAALCPKVHRAVRVPWRRRCLIVLLGALLLAAPPGQSSAADNTARLVAIYEVYGFLLGQQLRLQEIVDGQSGLRHEAVRTRATFDAAYPRLQECVERQLIRAWGATVSPISMRERDSPWRWSSGRHPTPLLKPRTFSRPCTIERRAT